MSTPAVPPSRLSTPAPQMSGTQLPEAPSITRTKRRDAVTNRETGTPTPTPNLAGRSAVPSLPNPTQSAQATATAHVTMPQHTSNNPNTAHESHPTSQRQATLPQMQKESASAVTQTTSTKAKGILGGLFNKEKKASKEPKSTASQQGQIVKAGKKQPKAANPSVYAVQIVAARGHLNVILDKAEKNNKSPDMSTFLPSIKDLLKGIFKKEGLPKLSYGQLHNVQNMVKLVANHSPEIKKELQTELGEIDTHLALKMTSATENDVLEAFKVVEDIRNPYEALKKFEEIYAAHRELIDDMKKSDSCKEQLKSVLKHINNHIEFTLSHLNTTNATFRSQIFKPITDDNDTLESRKTATVEVMTRALTAAWNINPDNIRTQYNANTFQNRLERTFPHTKTTTDPKTGKETVEQTNEQINFGSKFNDIDPTNEIWPQLDRMDRSRV